VTTTIQNCRDTSGNPVPQGCAAQTHERNVRTSIRYDALGRSYEAVDPLEQVTHMTFDGLGRTTATTRNYVLGGPTTPITNVMALTAYDPLGRTTVMTDALGTMTRQAAMGSAKRS
jgi:YD repeat-containing protein